MLHLGWQDELAGERGFGSQLFEIVGCVVSSLLQEGIETAQFRRKQRGLQGIEPEISADTSVVVLGLRTMDTQDTDLLGESHIACCYHPAIPKAT